MATLGVFDPETRQEALFDETVVDVGWFDPELIDAAGGGGAQTGTATPSITLSLAPNASATLGATAAPSITLSVGETALVIALATASPSITLSLAPVARVIGLAQATPSITLSLTPVANAIALATATPSITLSLAPNASATLGATASPSITLSLSPSGLVIAQATTSPSITLSLAASAASLAAATPSITLSLAPSGFVVALATASPSITLSLAPNASATLGATAAPSIKLSLGPVALGVGLATATPSITLSLAPVALKIGLATATPSILLTLAPTATSSGPGSQVGTATPSITLSLAPAGRVVALATATPSIKLTLNGVVSTVSTATPSIKLSLAPSATAVILARTPPPGVGVIDSFNRANFTGQLGTADSGQVWASVSGGWSIVSNTAKLTSTVGPRSRVVVESGVGNAAIQVTISPSDAAQVTDLGLVFRSQDSQNYFVFRVKPNTATAELFKSIASTRTTLVSTPYTPSAASVLRVVCDDTTLDCYVDGALVIHATGQTQLREATRHGLFVENQPNTVFDNFSIVAQPAPTITLALAPTAQKISTATVYTVNNASNEQGLREEAISYRGSR